MKNLILILLCVVPLVLYIVKMKNFKLTPQLMVVISVASGMAYVLNLISFIKLPNGGGIQLLSMLPVLMVSILYGRMAGITTGLIYGLLSLVSGPYIIHPAQFMFDYVLARMSFGLADICGTKTKWQIFLGSTLAVMISVLWSVLSGCIFFAEYAGGMNPLVYSLVYNFSCVGVEGLLSAIVITILPLSTLRKVAKVK